MLKRLLLAALTTLAAALAAHAVSVLPLYFEEIVDNAKTAFQGTCIGNHTERDAETGMVVTYTTFSVQEVLKGKPEFTHTIKQAGGQLADGSLEWKMEGVPKFTVGGNYVVFLPGVSSAGFSSPVGLGQGRFTVVADGDGAQVTNGRDFKEMTSRMAAHDLPKAAISKLERSGPVKRMGLDEFKQMVRQRAGAVQ